MKKKLFLLVAMLALVICMLAVSVSAHDTTRKVKLDSGTEVALYDSDGDALTWYMDGENLVSKKTKDVISVNGSGVASYNGINTMSVVVANFQGAEVEALDVKQVPVYYYGANGGGYHSYNDVVEYIYLPDTLTKTVTNQFRCTSKLKIVDVTRNSSWSEMGQYCFYYATGLTEFNYPPRVKTTPGASNDGERGTASTFSHCTSLKKLYFYDNSEVETFGASCFTSCTALETVVLPDSLKTFPGGLFSYCTSLKEITIPNGVTTIANHAFSGCSSLEVIRMGASVQYFNNTGDNSFTYQTGKVKEIYIPKSFYATAPTTTYQVSYAFHGASANCKFFYCGTVGDFATAKANFLTQTSATSNNGSFLNATVITYSEYLKNTNSYATGRYVICDYSACDAFYDGEHKEADTANGSVCYLADCSRCNVEKKDISSDATHSLNTQYVYANGYMAAGQIVSVCQNSGCKHGTEQTAITSPLDAIFTDLEYSVAEKGFGICVKYNVNRAALAIYKNSGDSISFGVVAVMADKVEGNGPLANNGELTTQKNVIAADVTADNLRAVTLRIAGDENAWKDNASRAIYVLGYATNGTDLEYLGTASGAQVDRNNITSVKSLVIGNFFNFNA